MVVAAVARPAQAASLAAEATARLLAQVEPRIKAIYETDEFRMRSFRGTWLPHGSGYLKLETPDGASAAEIARFDSASGQRTVAVAGEKLLVPGTTERLRIHGFLCSPTGKRFLLHTETAGGKDGSDRWLYEPGSGDLRPVKAGDGVGFDANAFSPDAPAAGFARRGLLAAHEVATGDRSRRERGSRFIDYYGPARIGMKTVSVYQALDPEQFLPRDFFKGKIVFVGLSNPAAAGPAPKDAFLTPFTGGRGETTFGVEIHATIAANLLEGRRFDLLRPELEIALLVLLPVTAFLAFAWLDPRLGALALLVMAALPWATAHVAFERLNLWVPAVIPSAIQLPLAYTVSVIWYYLTTVRERERVKRAFPISRIRLHLV